MQLTDIAHLNNYLQRLYGERYAGLTADMGLIWLKHLQSFPLDLAEQAVERWATTHLLHQLPTLTDIATGAEEVQREQRRKQRNAVPANGDNGAQPYGDAMPPLLRETLLTLWPDYDAPDEEERICALDVNPPNPDRWLPLNEDFDAKQPVRVPTSGALELKRLSAPRTEKDT